MILNRLTSSLSINQLLKPTNLVQVAERYKGKFWIKKPKELQNVRNNSLRKHLMREHKKKMILKKLLDGKYILANTW